MNLDPIRAAIAPYALLIKLGLVAVLAISMFIGGWNRGADKWQGKFDGEVRAHAATRTAHAATLRQLADKAKAAAAKAKAASEQARADRAAADTKLKDATHEAKRNAAALAAALRAGKRRLSDVWSCPVRRPAGGAAAGDAGQAASAGQYDSAARIVAAADADAAVIEFLWSAWQADRRAVIAAGCAVEATP